MKNAVLLLLLFCSCSAFSQSNECVETFEDLFEKEEFQEAFDISLNCSAFKSDTALMFKQAECASEIGDYEFGLKLYRSLIQKGGYKLDYVEGMGATYYALNNLDSSLFYTDMLIKEFPSFEFGHYNRALILFDLGYLDSAMLDATRQSNLFPDDSEVWVLMGNIQMSKDEPKNAESCYRKALEISLKNKDNFRIAEAYYFLDEWEHAMSYIDIVIKEDPFADAFRIKGDIYIFQEEVDYKKALKNYQKAEELGSTDADIYNRMAVCYEGIGKLSDALNFYSAACEMDPENIEYKVNKAYVLTDFDMYDEALEIMDQCMKLDPKDGWLYFVRAEMFSNQGEYLKAVNDYTQAIELDGNQPDYLYDRGCTYMDMGNFVMAIKDFDQVIRIEEEESLDVFYNRGYCYMQRGKYYEAIDDFDKVVEIDPTDSDAFYNRAVCYLELQKYGRACRDMKRASLLGDKDARAYLKENCR